MSTQQMIATIQSLPFSDQIAILEALVQSLKKEAVSEKKNHAHREEFRRRRREFKVEAFDLVGEVTFDRDELYSERGL